MSDSKVKCQCCGKVMTPTVLKSRGVFVGWEYGWWFGGGKPVSSCCPFCLSEEWDGKPDIRDTMLWRHVGFVLSILAFFLFFLGGIKLNAVLVGQFVFDFGVLGLILSLAGAIGFFNWFTK